MKIRVLHAHYGCDTGCCGHVIAIDGEANRDFDFAHPESMTEESMRQFAEEFISNALGPEHVKDLDWENSEVSND